MVKLVACNLNLSCYYHCAQGGLVAGLRLPLKIENGSMHHSTLLDRQSTNKIITLNVDEVLVDAIVNCRVHS